MKIAWLTKGCLWIFCFLIDLQYVSVLNRLPACCAGFEVYPSVMNTYEHISRPRRLIIISRRPADHMSFLEPLSRICVFVLELYEVSCNKFMDYYYAKLRWVHHKLTCWRLSRGKLAASLKPWGLWTKFPLTGGSLADWHSVHQCSQNQACCEHKAEIHLPLAIVAIRSGWMTSNYPQDHNGCGDFEVSHFPW